MATLTIRNLDEGLKARLRLRAAKHDRSMEEEARSILRGALAVGGADEAGPTWPRPRGPCSGPWAGLICPRYRASPCSAARSGVAPQPRSTRSGHFGRARYRAVPRLASATPVAVSAMPIRAKEPSRSPKSGQAIRAVQGGTRKNRPETRAAVPRRIRT